MNPLAKRKGVLFSLLILILFATIVISVMIGTTGPLLGAGGEPQMGMNEFFSALLGGDSETYRTIIREVRLPRVLLAGLVGCGLALSGCTMQAIFRNPLADPYLLGISSGGAAGAALSMFTGLKGYEGVTLPLFAFLGGLGAVFLVYILTWTTCRGRIKMEILLLAGVAVGSFFGAVTSFLMYAAGMQFRYLWFWLLGGFTSTSWDKVILAYIPIMIGCVCICIFARELNALLLGEEHAMYLGVNVNTLKRVLICIVSLITGVCVAFSGIIGFVGLIIPHAVRLLLGPDHRVLLPASCIVGGSFLIWADVIARSALASGGVEVPVGIITALFGAPFFLYILIRRRRW